MNHPLTPIIDSKSKILILGSFPSVMSRKAGFYYANPQNRFWSVLSKLFHEELPTTNNAKIELLHRHHLALWDVIQSCDIIGSSDGSIDHVIPNDITQCIAFSSITKIYANGNLAYDLYQKHCFLKTGIPIIRLPSTSSANARYSLESLVKAWSVYLLEKEVTHD